MSKPPKMHRYQSDFEDVERRIVSALPEIIDRLIDKAKEGDVRAAAYLCDRMLGRSASLKMPPSEDWRTTFYDSSDGSDTISEIRRMLD
jgi:hypothetical protein